MWRVKQLNSPHPHSPPAVFLSHRTYLINLKGYLYYVRKFREKLEASIYKVKPPECPKYRTPTCPAVAQKERRYTHHPAAHQDAAERVEFIFDQLPPLVHAYDLSGYN
jgi:hypothetical protein